MTVGAAGGTGWQVVAHEIESLFTVLGLLVSVFALARAFKKAQRWRDLRMPSLIAGFATVAVFVGLLFVGGGLAVRLRLGVWFAWWHLCRTDCSRSPERTISR